jgi:hypothetical protein
MPAQTFTGDGGTVHTLELVLLGRIPTPETTGPQVEQLFKTLSAEPEE